MSRITRCWWLGSWKLVLASSVMVGGAIAYKGDCALAQITPDRTLPNNSIVTPSGNTSVISGGTQKGSNLFHSFEEFSVPTHGAAYFNNALDIQNIISRVTGESISNIDGLIRANGTANLFLLNPNGIIFGPNASLNIGGSFLASTASSVKFADGTQFSATAVQTTPLLTVSVPLGLQFGGTAGRILNQSQAQSLSGETNSDGGPVGLQVQPGKTLALIGGDVVLEGGNLTAAGGRIELGSVAGVGEVSLSQTGNSWVLGYDEIDAFGDIRLEGELLVDASGSGGGDLQIQSARLEMTQGASIFADTLGSETGSEVLLHTTSVIALSDSFIYTDVFGSGSGGNLRIETGQLIIRDGAQIGSGTVGEGSAGNLEVNASESVEVIGESATGEFSSVLSTSADRGATGDGGNLTIETGRLIVRDGAQIQAATFGPGSAGTLAVNASESVELSGTKAFGRRDASGLFASVEEGAAGSGGNLTVETGRLIVRDGAQVSASTFGSGSAGTLTVNASESVELRGTSAFDSRAASGLYASVNLGATGSGGNLTLETGRLIIWDGGTVFVGTLGSGKGGTLAVNASESVELRGTSANGQVASDLTARTFGTGDAGDLTIETGQLVVRDGAKVTVSSERTGNAGNLEVAARSIRLEARAALNANTTAGQGNIILDSQDLVLRRGSNITTNATGRSVGGNITIDTGVLAALEDSDISANAQEAFGGRVIIDAQGIFGTEFREDDTPQSDITATSLLGPEFSGTVEINTPDVDPAQGLINLPTQPTEPEVVQACQPGGEQDRSEFVITGRGGLPPSPHSALDSDAIQVDWVTLNPEISNRSNAASSTNSTRERAITRIVEANGWMINNKGEVVLTVTARTATPYISWEPEATAPTATPYIPWEQQTPAQTQSLVQQGKTLYEAGQFTLAVKVLQQAAAAFKAQGDGLGEAMTLSNLSLAFEQLGQWPQAEQAIAESLNLLQTGRNMGTSTSRMRKAHATQTQILAQTLNVKGRLQLVQGQAEQALNTWMVAADTYAQVGDAKGVTRSRINSAQALQAKGLYRQAQKTLTSANLTLQKEPDSSLKATGLRSLGNVFRVVGDLKTSRQVLEQSLEVATRLRKAHAKRTQSNQAISDALLSLGNTARAQQDTQAALKFYQQAATASASHSTRIQAQLNQLRLLLDNEQLNAAKALWPQIQSQIANLPPSRTAVYARINFAQGLTRLRQHTTTDTPSWQDIAQLLTTAVQQAKNLGDQRSISYSLGNLGEVYEQTQQWSSAQDLTQQALFIAQAIDAPDIAYRWQWQLGRLLKTQGDVLGAIAAYTEAVNNLQSLRSDLVAINPDVQFSFRKEVEPVYRQLVDLLLKSDQGSQPSQKNLKQAREVIESLQLAELANFFRENCLVVKQADFVDEKAAVIYPILLDDRLEVILSLPRQNLRHYATPLPPHQVESRLESLRQNLILPYTSEADILPLSQEVYNWLIQPAQTALAESGVETLVFVLDGPLRNIPMAALYDGEQYLVEKYSIALTPGLQLVDPKPLAQRQLQALTAGLSEERLGFEPLKYVERELSQINSEIPTQVLLNQEFTSTSLDNKVNSSPVPVVHIATHGQFSSQAEQTFILAWDGRINVNELDNLLRARDQSLFSTLELLVLSACETADGDERAALGLAGVAVRAGARSTLASLWLVDDESTALLMSQFYQELNTGVTKAEALRRAQQALLHGNYKHPRLWAAFVLLGNWL